MFYIGLSRQTSHTARLTTRTSWRIWAPVMSIPTIRSRTRSCIPTTTTCALFSRLSDLSRFLPTTKVFPVVAVVSSSYSLISAQLHQSLAWAAGHIMNGFVVWSSITNSCLPGTLALQKSGTSHSCLDLSSLISTTCILDTRRSNCATNGLTLLKRCKLNT